MVKKMVPTVRWAPDGKTQVLDYDRMIEVEDNTPTSSHKSSTPASIALDKRQHAAFDLIKRTLMDEVAGNLHFQGARFSTADTDAICAKVRKLVGTSAGAAADKLDRLTKSVIGAMESGDRARAQSIAASRTSDALAETANAVGASPLWSAPTPAETGEPGPAELADQIIRR